MRAEDILPDHVNQGVFQGVAIRKGTVAAFLASARTWLDEGADAGARASAEDDMRQALPALRALGLFEVLAPGDARLRAFVDGPDRS